MIAMLEEDWGVYGSYEPPKKCKNPTEDVDKHKNKPKKKAFWKKLWFKL